MLWQFVSYLNGWTLLTLAHATWFYTYTPASQLGKMQVQMQKNNYSLKFWMIRMFSYVASTCMAWTHSPSQLKKSRDLLHKGLATYHLNRYLSSLTRGIKKFIILFPSLFIWVHTEISTVLIFWNCFPPPAYSETLDLVPVTFKITQLKLNNSSIKIFQVKQFLYRHLSRIWMLWRLKQSSLGHEVQLALFFRLFPIIL